MEKYFKFNETAIYRFTLLFGSLSYILWWLLLRQNPFHIEDIRFRIAVCLIGSLSAILSYISEYIKQMLQKIFIVCCYLISIHHLFIVYINKFDSLLLMGTLILVFAVAITIPNLKSLISYFLFIILVSLVLFFKFFSFAYTFFLCSMITLFIISFYMAAVKEKIAKFNELERINHEKEKDELKIQILNASKFAAIGTLTASIAHEIKNPLTIIKISMAILKDKHTTYMTPETLPYFESIERAELKIEALVNSLRNYSRDQQDTTEKASVHAVIEETLMLMNDLFAKENIKINKIFNTSDSIAVINTSKLQQILLNLFSNSLDALEGRTKKMITITSEKDEHFLVIKVTDNGCGIFRENVHKIFNTFFTTKPKDKGTGFGMKICRTLMTSMNGEISISSELDVGTTVTLTFAL